MHLDDGKPKTRGGKGEAQESGMYNCELHLARRPCKSSSDIIRCSPSSGGRGSERQSMIACDPAERNPSGFRENRAYASLTRSRFRDPARASERMKGIRETARALLPARAGEKREISHYDATSSFVQPETTITSVTVVAASVRLRQSEMHLTAAVKSANV